ncbi:MAG TPA: DUF4347 domain-containing protein [Thermoanaerobaculia bacterium]
MGNLKTCIGADRTRRVTIVGHGLPGFLYTNVDNVPTAHVLDEDTLSDFSNYLPVSPAEIVLFGCDVGKGSTGAKVVREVAAFTGATVFARTGFIFCACGGPCTYEPGTGWVSSDSAQRFAAEPTRQTATLTGHIARLQLQVPWPLVKHISLTLLSVSGEVIFERELHGREVAGLLRLFIQRAKFVDPGCPLAAKAAVVEIDFANKHRRFDIYNDRLAVDSTSRAWYAVTDFGKFRLKLLGKDR